MGKYVTMQGEKDGSCFSVSSEMRIARCADGPTWNTTTLALEAIPNILRGGGTAEKIVGCGCRRGETAGGQPRRRVYPFSCSSCATQGMTYPHAGCYWLGIREYLAF